MSGKNQGILKWMISGNPEYALSLLFLPFLRATCIIKVLCKLLLLKGEIKLLLFFIVGKW